MNAPNHLTATSEMLIRKPIGEVFEAMVNPKITSQFWFTEGSARLEEGALVEWTWGQFDLSATISVRQVKVDQFISFEWPSGEGATNHRTVDISFKPISDTTTFVHVVESGFDKEDEQLIQTVAGQAEGWTLVLAGLKAWLEYSINLNLIRDHKPDEG